MVALVLVADWGWGFYLDHFELLYSTQGVVYGAGYTADHVTRIAYWLMVGAASALCALLLLNVFRPRLGGHPKPAIEGHFKTGQRKAAKPGR
jgi:hypothetical protein